MDRVVTSLSDAASRVQADVADLQKDQIDRQRESVAALQASLRGLQTEFKDQGAGQVAAFREASDAIRSELSDRLQALAPDLKSGLDGLASATREAVTEQLGGLRDAVAATDRSLQDFARSLERVPAGQAKRLEEAVTALKDLAAGVNGGLGEKLTRQVDAFEKTLRGFEKLESAQTLLSTNLKYLADSALFKKTLTGLGDGVSQLGDAIDQLDRRFAQAAERRNGFRLPFKSGRGRGA